MNKKLPHLEMSDEVELRNHLAGSHSTDAHLLRNFLIFLNSLVVEPIIDLANISHARPEFNY